MSDPTDREVLEQHERFEEALEQIRDYAAAKEPALSRRNDEDAGTLRVIIGLAQAALAIETKGSSDA